MSLKEFLFGFSDKTKARHKCLFVSYDINRHTCHRTIPMEVLCLGMGRTGTASMKQALEILGIPACHGFDMHSNLKDGDMWREAFAAKYFGDRSVVLDREFWDKLLGHVAATTDTPANCFGPELIAAYPQAKVILVERDIDTWYLSFERALITANEVPSWVKIAAIAVNEKAWKLRAIIPGIMKGQFRAKDHAEWRKNAKSVYQEHYAEIRNILKDQPERLLDYKLDSGWDPLCEFLDKPIPDVAFPRVNEAAQHNEMIRVMFMQMVQDCILASLKIAIPILGGYIAWRLRW